MYAGYTAIVGAVALLFGDLAVGLGLYGPFAALGVCTAVLAAIKGVFGRQVEGEVADPGKPPLGFDAKVEGEAA